MYDLDGHKVLARDPKTNMILNVNDHDYQHYIASREAKKVKNENGRGDIKVLNSWVFSSA